MALVIDPTRREQLRWALDLLKANEPVALPTETVYGLAGRVYSDLALGRIFALKNRPHFDPLIAHVNGIEMAKELCASLHEVELELMRCFWPGPLTLLCQKSQRIPDLCTGGSGLVGLRSPADAIFTKILNSLGEPLAAPSANRFQGVSPTSYRDVLSELGAHGLAAVVDGGACHLGIESTVVRFDENRKTIFVFRLGACDLERLNVFASQRHLKVALANSVLDERATHHAPGQAAKHYSPSKPVIFYERAWAESSALDSTNFRERDLFLFVTHADLEIAVAGGFVYQDRAVVLGKGKLDAAAALFKALRNYDTNEAFARLVAFAPTNESLGAAIADRLRRAAASGDANN